MFGLEGVLLPDIPSAEQSPGRVGHCEAGAGVGAEGSGDPWGQWVGGTLRAPSPGKGRAGQGTQ